MFKRLGVVILTSIIFALAASWFAHEYKSRFQPQELAVGIRANVHFQLAALEKEAGLLRSQPAQGVEWGKTHYNFLLFDSTRLLAWTSQHFVPEVFDPLGKDSVFLFQSSRGDYLIKQWPLEQRKILVGVLPLVERFKVSNEYIKTTWNPAIFPIDNIQVIDPNESVGLPIANFFNIGDELIINAMPFDWRSFGLALISLVALVIGIRYIIAWMYDNGWIDFSFLALLVLLATARVVMIQLDFPNTFGYWHIFDPQKFASSWLNVSLGDFLLNSLVVAACSIYLFTIYPHLRLFNVLTTSNRWIKVLASILFLTLALFAFLFPFLFYEIIFHNSSIHLDVTQYVFFDELRVIAFLCVVLGTVSSFVFCHITVSISKHLLSRNDFLLTLVVAVSLFMLYTWVSSHDYAIPLMVGIGYILVIYFSRLSSSLTKISFVSFSYFLVATCAYGLLGALSIRYFSQEATRKAQLRFATNTLVNHDILGEFILHDAGKKIAQDPFIQSRFSNPFLSKSIIKQHVQQLYINPYFDRYDVNVYLYNVAGESIANDVMQDDFVTSIERVRQAAVKTDYEGVYWVKEEKTKSIKRYVCIVPVTKSSPLGYVLIDLCLKKIAPHAVYLELLVDNRLAQFLNTEDFSYGFFTKGRMITGSGDFNYQQHRTAEQLSNPLIFSKGLSVEGYDHIALENDDGEVVVVSAKSYAWFYVLANFSFWFVLGLFLVFIWMLGYALLGFYQGYKPTYSARIQLYIYAAFILPLLALAVATLAITNQTYERELGGVAETKSETLAETIASWLEKPDSTLDVGSFSAQLSALSKSSQTDVSVYGPNGQLIASSQPLIFENQFLSKHMNRQAWQNIYSNSENYLVLSEQIGRLKYSSSYRAIRSSSTNELLGVVNFPFFKSARAAEKSQALVFSNVLVVFAVVFIFFNIVSLFAVRWLTFPLQFITKTLSNTTLIGSNKPLQWHSNDEIGMMVSEYNRMLANLEKSKTELARTQKESAWREMAQQVAHEIKNPLTPMKLTLQRMEANTGLESIERQNAIKTLLQQLEILNGIATSFSSFAKMPVPVLSRIHLTNTLRKATKLYEQGTTGRVVVNEALPEVWVMGDEQLLIRIFSNLILNGLQSYTLESEAFVELNLKFEGDLALLSFADKGVGIADDYRDKIFIPSFSTKNTGSGLGLAIAKQGIEYMGGKIWFESTDGMGTTFFISMTRQTDS